MSHLHATDPRVTQAMETFGFDRLVALRHIQCREIAAKRAVAERRAAVERCVRAFNNTKPL